jgi:hypothetical protein
MSSIIKRGQAANGNGRISADVPLEPDAKEARPIDKDKSVRQAVEASSED